MKANELMIGDWVYIVPEEERDKTLQVQVDRIIPHNNNRLTIGKGNLHSHYDLITPIPLTEEILKANGWEKDKFGSAYINHGVPFRLDIGICCLWLDHEWDDYYNAFSFNYVHQLQHALRLCGLNDLADNFKV